MHSLPSIPVQFPSIGDRQLLLQNRSSKGVATLSLAERWAYHAYDYGWRRCMLGDYQKISAIDLEGRWFNERLVRQAETMWRDKYNRPAPAVNSSHPEPTAEDIAHVQNCCRTIRSNLAAWSEQNARSLGKKPKPAYVVDGDAALAQVQRDLGIKAEPSVEQERQEALQRMERE